MTRYGIVPGVALAAILASVVPAWAAAPAEPAYLKTADRAMIRSWLAGHPGYRLTTDADCRCDQRIRDLRTSSGAWPAQRDFHPYFARGDFNRDRHEDIALGVRAVGERGQFRVLILSRYAKPYLSDRFLLGEAIFYGPPRPKPYLLLVGRFETEAGSLEPTRGGGYRYAPSDCC